MWGYMWELIRELKLIFRAWGPGASYPNGESNGRANGNEHGNLGVFV